jgi:hypothetical protein
VINFASRLFAEKLASIAQACVASSDDADMKGINVRVEKTRYGSRHVLVTLEFTEAGRDTEKEDFERAAPLLGLKPEHYGASIQLQDDWYTIVGISLNRPKFPVDIKRTRDGKKFKLTETGALAALARHQ